MIINAENRVIGRLASEIARKAKEGEEIKVINSEKVVISGEEKQVMKDYKQKYERGTRHRGPYFPKRPDKILKRTIKGMLPTNKPEGREAISNVKTYLSIPIEMEKEEITEAENVKKGDELKNRNYVKLGDVSKHIGWTPRGEE